MARFIFINSYPWYLGTQSGWVYQVGFCAPITWRVWVAGVRSNPSCHRHIITFNYHYMPMGATKPATKNHTTNYLSQSFSSLFVRTPLGRNDKNWRPVLIKDTTSRFQWILSIFRWCPLSPLMGIRTSFLAMLNFCVPFFVPGCMAWRPELPDDTWPSLSLWYHSYFLTSVDLFKRWSSTGSVKASLSHCTLNK